MIERMMWKRTKITAGITILGIASATFAFAWNEPTAAPPGNNAPAPINVGTTDQVKNGRLGVNALAVFGNSLFGGSTGSNAYLNFGPTTGDDGYGIRDNAGILEFKNNGGSWASLQNIIYTLVGSSTDPWTTSGSNIYYNAGRVGIGTASSAEKLDLGGGKIKMGYEQVSGVGSLVMPQTISDDAAHCPVGKNVIGGGCLSNWYMTHITKSYPFDESTWYCAAYNTGSSQASTIYAYAICANMK